MIEEHLSRQANRNYFVFDDAKLNWIPYVRVWVCVGVFASMCVWSVFGVLLCVLKERIHLQGKNLCFPYNRLVITQIP